MPPGLCLGALERLRVEMYNVLIVCPLYSEEKMPLRPCPFKNEAYMLGT